MTADSRHSIPGLPAARDGQAERHKDRHNVGGEEEDGDAGSVFCYAVSVFTFSRVTGEW
jgi:hypothetical protein